MFEIQDSLAKIRRETVQKARREYEQAINQAEKRFRDATREAEDEYKRAWKAAYNALGVNLVDIDTQEKKEIS